MERDKLLNTIIVMEISIVSIMAIFDLYNSRFVFISLIISLFIFWLNIKFNKKFIEFRGKLKE